MTEPHLIFNYFNFLIIACKKFCWKKYYFELMVIENYSPSQWCRYLKELFKCESVGRVYSQSYRVLAQLSDGFTH